MERRISKWIEQYRHMDWAVLYMRLFAGGVMLFHNIGKMQNYNDLIGSYPSLLYIDSAASFVLIAVAEVLCATLIIIGVWVRMSALCMSLGLLLALLWGGFGDFSELFMWLGVFVFLVISGGGTYSFDSAFFASNKSQK